MFKPIKIKNLIIDKPIILAPLCGITDSPFRRICIEFGAGLVFIEMISSTALIYNNKKTFNMLYNHKSEHPIGIQLTARYGNELAESIEIIKNMDFSIIDINMGCPVKKVVKNGGGSASLKDPNIVYDFVKKARNVTDKPISVKIRAGWDRDNLNFIENSKAIEEAGADLITIHGRTKADKYSKPNNLDWIAQVKETVSIPVIGNGDLFSVKDILRMKQKTNVDGVMLARGILGNPFLFKRASENLETDYITSIDEWKNTVLQHLKYFEEIYGNVPNRVVTMRKHLLWYSKGLKDSKKLRNFINNISDLEVARKIIIDYCENNCYE